MDVALHFGPERYFCAEKLNKNNDQVRQETFQLFKSGMARESPSEDHHAEGEAHPRGDCVQAAQVDVLVAPGIPVAEAIRAIGVTEVAAGRAAGWRVFSSLQEARVVIESW